MKKILLFALFVGIVSLGYVWIFVYNKSHQDILSEQVNFTTTSVQLAAEFNTNNETATQKYSNKVVQINGNVKGIFLDDSLSSIELVGNDNYTIICELLSTENTIASTTAVGTPITLKGFFVGAIAPDADFELAGDVRLKKCTVIKQLKKTKK